MARSGPSQILRRYRVSPLAREAERCENAIQRRPVFNTFFLLQHHQLVNLVLHLSNSSHPLSMMELLSTYPVAFGITDSILPSLIAIITSLVIFTLRRPFIGHALYTFRNRLDSFKPKTVKAVVPDETGTSSKLQDLKSLKGQHEAAATLFELIEKDGAGAWPPRANHVSWPAALRPYKEIYLELNPLLPSAEPSLDDGVNEERRNKYRSLMRKLFAERVNIGEVQAIMAAAEAGNWDVLPRDAYNGFYSAVAVCRHAYR